MKLKIHLICLWASLAVSTQAELVYHWTFDTDGSASVGDVAMIFNSNATQSTACSTIGQGALQVTSAGAPAVGGAVTESAIDWSAFANGDTRTISMWVRPTVGQESQATFFGAGVNNNSSRFDIKSSDNQNFRVEIQGTGQTTATSINDGSWHHVAVVVPNEASAFDEMIFYIDGAEVDNASGSSLPINTGTAIIRLGDSTNPAGDRDFNGFIDDVRIYDTALTPAEITTLFSEARPVRCLQVGDEQLVLGESTDLSWEAVDVSSLQITNDQDATTINALAIGASGSTTISPTVTTTYTITGTPTGGGDPDVRTLTVEVKVAPDIFTFTDSPDLIYGFGDVTLNWTTGGAQRITITDDQGSAPLVFTATADTQEFLDAGSTTIANVSTTTVYTLTATLAEDGSGATETLETTAEVQSAPDITLVAVPSVTDGTEAVTLFFNATLISDLSDTSISGVIDNFDGGTTLEDSEQDFTTNLPAGPIYIFQPLNADNSFRGGGIEVVSYSGTAITLAADISQDFDWPGNYVIFGIELSGADQIVINDGTSDIATITDPALIAAGSLDLGVVPASTTYTATASITGAGAAQATASVDTTGTGNTYEEVVRSDSPVGYYRFEEQARTAVIYDYSGNANHSTNIIGADFLLSDVEGAIGRAATFVTPRNEFNNSTNGVSIVTGVTLDPSDPDGDDVNDVDNVDFDPDGEGWSLTALVKPDFNLTDGNLHIWSNENGDGFGRSNLYINPDRTLTSFVGGTSSPDPTTATVDNATPLIESGWCHIALTCTENGDAVTGDGETEPAPPTYTLRFYIDGNLEAEQLLPNATPDFSNGGWIIGAQKLRRTATYFEGSLDEVTIFDTPLSASRIAAHNAAFLANASGLLAFGNDTTIARGDTVNLIAKIGSDTTSATIDNGAGSVIAGMTNLVPVTPTETTTYTIDVDGEIQSVTITVVDSLSLVDSGLDNGSGNPFVTVGNVVEGSSYSLFRSTDLENWTPVGPVQVGDDSGQATFADPNALDIATNPKLFYQVRQQ